MLKGKGKEDFENTLKDINEFYNLSKPYQNRKIIEFFNSNGVILTFRQAKLGGCMCHFSNEFKVMGFNAQECKEKAIVKANEIYNNKIN